MAISKLERYVIIVIITSIGLSTLLTSLGSLDDAYYRGLSNGMLYPLELPKIVNLQIGSLTGYYVFLEVIFGWIVILMGIATLHPIGLVTIPIIASIGSIPWMFSRKEFSLQRRGMYAYLLSTQLSGLTVSLFSTISYIFF